MTEFFLKFPLFYLANEEIQSGKIQNNMLILNFPAPFSAGFPLTLQDKRVGISKVFLSFLTLFLYIPWVCTRHLSLSFYWITLCIFQISMSHPLDSYQKSLRHVHHVCYCFEFHSSGIRRSCERRVAKKCIPGKSRLRFHGYFYDGMHSESKAFL